jgi:cell division protein FtsA
MEGVVELAEEIFHMPVRLASPNNVAGLSDVVNNPMYATGVGLLKYGLSQQDVGAGSVAKNTPNKEGVVSKLKNWFTGNF